MKKLKLKLDLDQVQVASFPTRAVPEVSGTVRGLSWPTCDNFNTCDPPYFCPNNFGSERNC